MAVHHNMFPLDLLPQFPSGVDRLFDLQVVCARLILSYGTFSPLLWSQRDPECGRAVFA